MVQAATHDSRKPSRPEWLLVIVTGCCLSAFVWRGLLSGGGLVGGDTYPYFFPQKQVLAESFARGEIPLWHDRTALGYPMHAESQAGVFYPSNQILYRLFDVNTAYSLSTLLHYVAAYVFAWRFCRSQWLSPQSAMLAAMVFVYGWFPMRISLEWSIIGGVWLPLSLWMTERFLQQPNMQRWTWLVVCLGIHLLAGHFTLAFITQLTCLTFGFLTSPARTGSADLNASENADKKNSAGDRELNRWRAVGLVSAAILCAVLLAAVQLAPTLELRQLSQRDGSGSVFDPSYGHMPPVYLTQLVASWWYWHTPEMALSREMLKHPLLMSSAGTNPVEAHLYVGLIPFLLLLATASRNIRQLLRRTHWRTWGCLSLAAVVYAFGWLVPLFRYLPGFGFFMGPGRYTIVTTLGLAIIAGLVLDALQRRQKRITRTLITLTIALVTLGDLLTSAVYPVCDAEVVASPPLAGLQESWLAATLQEHDQAVPVRLLCGGPNIGNLFGVSSVPQYLGLGPAEYFAANATVETQPTSAEQVFPSPEQILRLKAFAVTHILTSEPVSRLSPDCELVALGPDTFLNRVWARGNAACFLYRLRQPRNRISATPPEAMADLSILYRSPSDIRFDIDLSSNAEVELTDLMFPGWTVFVDGEKSEPKSVSGFGRKTDVSAGRHSIRWLYRPGSFFFGAAVSLATLLAMCVACIARR